MSLAKQLQDFITASLEVGMGWEKGSVWDRVVELQKIQASQHERAFYLNMKLAQLTGKSEYLQKAADIAEKASKLDLVLSKEVREAYRDFAREIREGNINFNKQINFPTQEQGRAYVDLRGANLKDVNITIAEKVNEVKNAVHTLQEGKDKDFSKDKAEQKEQKADLREQKDKADLKEQKAEQKAEKVEHKQAEQKQAEQKEQKAEFQRFVEGTKNIQPEKTELKDFKQEQAKGQEQRGQEQTKETGKDRVESKQEQITDKSKQEQAKQEQAIGQDKQEQAKGQEQAKETGQDKDLKPDLGLGR